MRSLLSLGGIAAAILAWNGAVAAQTAEEFYCDQSELRIVVSSSPGGGYDTFGRLVAQYMSRYIPCNPTFVVENMPGGGGVRAGNYLYNTAPRDGTVISIIDRGVLTAPILYGASTETQFDGTEFLWLGSLVQERGVGMVRTDAPIGSLADATTTKAFFGASGVETDAAMYARLVNSLLGTQIETITGYAGQTEYYLAMEQGETDGLFMSGWSGPNRLQAMQARDRGDLKFIVQMARDRDPEVGEDVPTIYELLQNEDDRKVIDLLLSRLILGRPFIAPPGIPEDRFAVLRNAFASAVQDPELLADMERLNYRISPVLGEEAQKLMADVYATPEEVISRVREIVAVQN
jgi:tripartite-type tricarboxylate transporter receptor subunit TctC